MDELTSEETGVGATIAAGNQVEKGITLTVFLHIVISLFNKIVSIFNVLSE